MFVNRSGFRGTLGKLDGRRVNSPCRHGERLPLPTGPGDPAGTGT
ncbi:hypothetical protein EDD93_0965 [Streptomyces sp. 840.1]|nr:hypothetical protein EDD93_0965 [Streptomyces sp. 840.1]